MIATVAVGVLASLGGTSDWTWPLDDPAPQVVREFEPPAELWLPGHRGVDVAGDSGDVVRAAGAGTISFAGMLAGVGVVTVSHGAVRTTYQPVTPVVAVGQRVAIGAAIGTLSPVGSHCPPRACLHWGLIRGSVYLDPLRLVERAGPPRLLPLGAEAITPANSSSPVPPSPITARAAVGVLAGVTT